MPGSDSSEPRGERPELPESPQSPELEALAADLRALPPSCGPVRLIAVDGHAGSGKTTFAARLAAALGGAPVLHLDDLASHGAFFDWTERLTAQVLTPLTQGRTAHYAAYDWHRAAFPAEPDRSLPPASVVLAEGVGAGRRALRPYLAYVLWMDMAPEDAWRCGRARDGTDLAGFWDAWTRAETAHFEEEPSHSSANCVVRRRELGYEVLKRSARSR